MGEDWSVFMMWLAVLVLSASMGSLGLSISANMRETRNLISAVKDLVSALNSYENRRG